MRWKFIENPPEIKVEWSRHPCILSNNVLLVRGASMYVSSCISVLRFTATFRVQCTKLFYCARTAVSFGHPIFMRREKATRTPEHYGVRIWNALLRKTNIVNFDSFACLPESEQNILLSSLPLCEHEGASIHACNQCTPNGSDKT